MRLLPRGAIMLVSVLWLLSRACADDDALPRQSRQTPRFDSALSNYNFSTLTNAGQSWGHTNYSAPNLPSMPSFSQSQVSSLINDLHARNLQSPFVNLDPDEYLGTSTLTTLRTGVTFGVRPILTGLDVMGRGGSGFITGPSIGNTIAGMGERFLDSKIAERHGGYLILDPLQKADPIVGQMQSATSVYTLGRSLSNHWSSSMDFPDTPDLSRGIWFQGGLYQMNNGIYRPVATNVFDGAIRVKTGSLYVRPDMVMPTIRDSFDWRGAWQDTMRVGVGRGIGQIGGFAANSAFPIPDPKHDITHITTSEVVGSLRSAQSASAFLDRMAVVTSFHSSNKAISPDGRIFGFDPTTDSISRTTFHSSWQRDIVGPQSMDGDFPATGFSSVGRSMSWESKPLQGFSQYAFNSGRFSNSSFYSSPSFSNPSWNVPKFNNLPSLSNFSYTTSMALPTVSLPNFSNLPGTRMPSYSTLNTLSQMSYYGAVANLHFPTVQSIGSSFRMPTTYQLPTYHYSPPPTSSLDR